MRVHLMSEPSERGSDAWTQADLWALQRRAAAGFPGRAHLLVRVHVLCSVRRKCLGKCLFQLRRGICSEADQTGKELEERQLPRRLPRRH